MTILQAIFLGIVQGATEFIPVSSSGHLVIVPWLIGWETPGLQFAVFAHMGTAAGTLAYFWADWQEMLHSGVKWVRGKGKDDSIKRIRLIIIALIPTAIIGLIFADFFERVFQHPVTAIIMLQLTAILLFISERVGKQSRQMSDMRWLDSLIMGIAQTLAIMPGISRSGATIAAGRLRNLKRDDSARFSFLLLLPLISGVGILQIIDLVHLGIDLKSAGILVSAFVSAFASSYLVIRWLLRYLRTKSTDIFAIYCSFASILSLIVLVLRG